jgi:hypothetical protein
MMNLKTLLLYFFLGCSVFVFSQKKEHNKKEIGKDSISIAHSQSDIKGYPVAPFKDTLFFIYNKVGSFNAQNRANAIASRIELLYKDPFFSVDSLNLNRSESSVDIVYKSDFPIMSVTDLDGKKIGSTDFALAQ